jgi:hypothetical protein
MVIKHIPMPPVPAAIAPENFGRPTARIAPRHASRLDPRQFGRARPRLQPAFVERRSNWGLADDLWLFAATFLGAFVFVSIFIA